MRYGRLFWGILFVEVGVLLLLVRWDIMIVPWYYVWRLWPIVLVCLGLATLAGNRVIKLVAVSLAALCLGLLISSFVGSWCFGDGFIVSGRPVQRQELAESFDQKIRHAALAIEVGVGQINVRGTSKDLMAASSFSNLGTYSLVADRSNEDANLRLSMDKTEARKLGKDMKNHIDIRLRENPVWSISLDLGAGELDADLSPFKTEAITIDAGAADVNVRVGANVAESRVAVDAGAASIRIEVPEVAGCELRVESGLSSKHFPGFEKIESGLYRTDNFSSADQRIFVTLDAPVSSLRVERY